MLFLFTYYKHIQSLDRKSFQKIPLSSFKFKQTFRIISINFPKILAWTWRKRKNTYTTKCVSVWFSMCTKLCLNQWTLILNQYINSPLFFIKAVVFWNWSMRIRIIAKLVSSLVVLAIDNSKIIYSIFFYSILSVNTKNNKFNSISMITCKIRYNK